MNRLLLAPGHAYLPEAQALFARMTTPPSTARKVLINNTIRSLKAQGLWSLCDGIWFTAAADSQAASLNWKGSTGTLTAVNSPTFTADRGFAGDGSTSYLDTGLTGASVSRNSHAAGAWLNVTSSTIGGVISSGGTNAVSVVVRTTLNFSTLSATVSFDTGTPAGTTGFFGLTRTGGASYTTQQQASQATVGTASTGLTVANFLLLQEGGGAFANGRVAAAFMGAGLTPTQLSAMQTIFSAYLTPIGGA